MAGPALLAFGVYPQALRGVSAVMGRHLLDEGVTRGGVDPVPYVGVKLVEQVACPPAMLTST